MCIFSNSYTFSCFFIIIIIMQNWMSFGKVAHDLVVRIQKMDGDNYPEVDLIISETIL